MLRLCSGEAPGRSSSAARSKKANLESSSIACKRSFVESPAVDARLNSSHSRWSRSAIKSFKSRHSGEWPCPMNTLRLVPA